MVDSPFPPAEQGGQNLEGIPMWAAQELAHRNTTERLMNVLTEVQTLIRERDTLTSNLTVALDALEAARTAIGKEFLYQTGQTVRPAENYPPQGTICGELGDVMGLIVPAITLLKGEA